MLVLIALALTASCGKDDNKNAATDAGDEVNEANVKKNVKPEADAQAAVIETDYGRIVIELYPNLAPKMVERFKKLATEGVYNGTTIHRIDPELGIIQGGDPLSKDNNPDNDGGGDSPYPDLPAEFSDIPYERGTVGAARQGANPQFGITEEQAHDTGNCQFYITLKRVAAFDGNYTVFGRVVEGLNNADVIAGAPVEPPRPGRPEASQPSEKIVVKSITLQPRKQ
jgi:cyclophilin family peptidyl-prolyl cis-trans isomerase